MNDMSPDHSVDGASLEQRVLREHLATVYASHTSAIAAHLGFAVVLLFFVWPYLAAGSRSSILSWFVLVAVVDTYVLMAKRWTPDVPVADSPDWARKYTTLVTLTSLATAPACFLLMNSGSPEVTTVVTVVILGSWTRAVQARWSIKPAMFGYAIPMMSGLILALLWAGGVVHWLLAAFATVNLLLTLRAGVQQNQRLTESLILRFENEALATSLKEQMAISERVSAEKTRFLAAASHDLRQPMHAVALFGSTLERALVDHPARENVERLMRSVNALGASLDTMLDISRLDAGVVSAQSRAVEVDGLFLALNQTFAGTAEEKGLQLRLRPSGLWVRSDLQLLYRMLSNLIDNALKYTAQGGVSVSAHAKADKVWVDVVDTGIGIPPDQGSRIFEEFYQIDNPGRDRARGLGIGLSIVRRLAHLLDHPVRMRSRPGRGTRFRIQLPRIEGLDEQDSGELPPPADGLTAPEELHAPQLAGTRVLLIDDEVEIRAAMSALLRSHGIEVVAVASEAEALAVLEGLDDASAPPSFAMLVCDSRLADGADGLQAGLRLRDRFFAPSSMLLITGETSPERLLSARASGVPILFKPVSAAALLSAMDQMARSIAANVIAGGTTGEVGGQGGATTGGPPPVTA